MSIAWSCFNCMVSKSLQTHWLTSLGCQHRADGSGDNAASCWCGWNGPRVANVGEAVRSWAEHAAEQIAIEARTAQGIEAGTDETLQAAQPEGREPGSEGMRPKDTSHEQ